MNPPAVIKLDADVAFLISQVSKPEPWKALALKHQLVKLFTVVTSQPVTEPLKVVQFLSVFLKSDVVIIGASVAEDVKFEQP